MGSPSSKNIEWTFLRTGLARIKSYALLLAALILIPLILIAAAEEYWPMALIALLFLLPGLIWGIMDLRGDELDTRRAIGIIAILIEICILVFSLFSFVLFRLNLVHYSGNGVQTTGDHNTLVAFFMFYFWLFLDALPVLDVTKTLQFKSPVQADDATARVLIVMFRGIVVLLILSEIKVWWERTRNRSGGNVKSKE